MSCWRSSAGCPTGSRLGHTPTIAGRWTRLSGARPSAWSTSDRSSAAPGAERTRERVARERKKPWSEQDRWGLRKRVWRERRDSERVLLERRERALLERADELSAHAAQVAGWLRELCELEPAAQPGATS